EEIVADQGRQFLRTLRTLRVPVDAVRRAAADLVRFAARIPDNPRVRWAKQRPQPEPADPPSELVTLDYAALELWYFRDECHIGARGAQGYEGPEFEALSFVWSSRDDVSWTKLPAVDSLDRLVKALHGRQDPADVTRSVEALM